MEKPKLSEAAIKLIRETIEAEFACGSKLLANALELLLKWHLEGR